MRLIDFLLAEFDHECGVTRALLDRIPDDKVAWKPHDRSYTLGQLAVHLAELPAWIPETLRRSDFDLNPPDGSGPRRLAWVSRDDMMATFDRNVAAARAALVATTDAELAAPWTLRKSGSPLFTMPRGSVLRTWAYNHAVHHRGQLTVYLRLCGVPLPMVYGPTADTGT